MSANLALWVEELTVGNELAGQPAETWTRRERPVFFTVKTMSGSEFQQAQQMQSTATHAMECHYFAGANSRMRLKSDSPPRTFNVESVVNRNEQNRFLDWAVKEET